MSLSVLIIGAGPAGASTAALLARQGCRVTLVDRRPHTERKVCGECLSPPSREILERIGAWDRIARSGQWRPLKGITLIGPRGSRCSLDFGLEQPAFTVPRTVLDAALIQTAEEAGVQPCWSTQIAQIEQQPGCVVATARDGRRFEAELLIGADGRHSWVARKIGIASERPHWLKHAAIMSDYELPCGTSQDEVEMHVTPWGYAGLNPLPSESGENSRLNVITVLHPDELKRRLAGRGVSRLLEIQKELLSGMSSTAGLRSRLRDATPVSKTAWSVANLAWKPKKIISDGVALVGDSAGFIDPFTGEGLYHGLASAVELAGRLKENARDRAAALRSYAEWHREKFGPEELFCTMLQRVLPHPRLADYVIAQLARKKHLSEILAEAVADRLSTRKVLSPLYWGRVLWPVSG